MPKNENGPQPNGDKDITKNLSLKTYWVSIGVATLIVLVILGIVAHFRVNEHSESIRFFTVNTLSWLVFVAVVTQIIIYKKQWEAMQNTLKEMRISRELENRAWVGLKKIEVEQRPEGGVHLNGFYVNSGNTPANVLIKFKGEMRKQPPPNDIDLGPYEAKGSNLALFPHVEYQSVIASLEGLPISNNPKSYTDAWYIYGRLEYEDIFGHPHVTKFCYQTVEVGRGPEGQILATLVVSETHNTFD